MPLEMHRTFFDRAPRHLDGFISHLYLHRPSRSGYVVSFNTDASSSRERRSITRAVDDHVRDVMIRELFRAEDHPR